MKGDQKREVIVTFLSPKKYFTRRKKEMRKFSILFLVCLVIFMSLPSMALGDTPTELKNLSAINLDQISTQDVEKLKSAIL